MALSEADAARSELVEVRRAVAFATVAGEAFVAEVIGEDEHDVGFPVCCLAEETKGEAEGEKEAQHGRVNVEPSAGFQFVPL